MLQVTRRGANHVWARKGTRLQVTTRIELYAGEGVEGVGGEVGTGLQEGLVTGKGGSAASCAFNMPHVACAATLAALSSPSSCPPFAPV